MIMPIKIRIIFKTISALVAGIFLFEQVTWAGDLIETVLDRQYDEQAQTFAPSYLQNQQILQENVIAINQDAEIFQSTVTASAQTQDTSQSEADSALPLKGPRVGGSTTTVTSLAAAPVPPPSASDGQGTPDPGAPILSVTTAAGDIIRYKNNVIDSIEKKDGTVLRNITVDENNNLTGAEVTYTDGTVQIISGGKVMTITTPGKTTYYYNSEELIGSVIYSDGRVVAYTYRKDEISGSVFETVLNDGENESIYDSNGRLKQVTKKSGDKIYYQDGMLKEIVKPDNSEYIFTKKEETGEDGLIEYAVALSQYKDPDGNIYYYEDGKFVSIQPKNGDNVVKAIYDTAGGIIDMEQYGQIQDVNINILAKNSILRSRWFDNSDGSVHTWWGNEYLDYSVDFRKGTTDAVLKISAKNCGTIDSRYTTFKVEVFIDGISKGIVSIPASMTQYVEGSLAIGAIEGSHTIRVKWLNDFEATGCSANIQIKDIRFETKAPEIIHYDTAGKVTKIEKTDGFTLIYSQDGVLTKKVGPDGAAYNYQDGFIVDKVYTDNSMAAYVREYDLTGKPLKLTIKESDSSAQTYLFDELGALTAVGIDKNLPTTTPFTKSRQNLANTQAYLPSTGVVTTDGTYLYVKRFGYNEGSSAFQKIGTGYNGTIAGKNYGSLASSTPSYTATYYPDGYIYNPVYSNSYKMEKINVSTGAKSQIDVVSGLIDVATGKVKSGGYSLITSDGRYIYNVAYHINNGSTTTYNGWTVKVFDPQAGFAEVRKFTTGASSFYATGIVSDGQYIYAIQWTGTDSAKVAKISLSTNAVVDTFTINQGATNAIGGQYDWVNKKFWLGSSKKADIYKYNINETSYNSPSQVNLETAFKAENLTPNSTGVLATDGTYYYVKRWASEGSGIDSFEKIGTGNNGTIANKSYGILSAASKSISAAYYPDGNIYNPLSSNPYNIEKINVSTGVKSWISVPAGFLGRDTATVVSSGATLITSDGRYIYNAASHIDNGSATKYNGWTVKVFDPKNNWQVVKTYTVGVSSYMTDGFISDGVYLYFIEWTKTDSARVTASRISDGTIVRTWTLNQGKTGLNGGQYDWVNNKIYLGAIFASGIGAYDGFIKKSGLGSIDTDGMFTASIYSDLFRALADGPISIPPLPDFSDIESETQYKEIVYDTEFKLKKASGYDGSSFDFKDGIIDKAVDTNGILSDYGFELRSDAAASLTVERDGIKRIYDQYGNISQVSDSKEGVSFTMAGNAVSRIEKSDGTIIENAFFDVSGNIENAKITRPDGVVAIYALGVLAEIREPNGNIFYYDASGNITKYDKRGLVYNYSEELELGEAFTIAKPSDADLDTIQDPDEIVFQKYDNSKRLVQLKKKSGKVIDYSYALDPLGKVAAITTNDSSVVTVYDKDYNITRTEILPTANDPVSTISEYSYGKIRRVLKGNNLIYTYTYEYDGSGKEITVIKDIKTSDVKRYKDELLISVTDKNNLVTRYEYNADKKISKSTVSRSGKIVNRYVYSYDGDLTTMEDMGGVRRSYDKDNKIVYLEEEGRTYRYSYSKDDSGKDVTTQKLIRYINESGDTINYIDGEVESIVKTDGTILKDFIFVDKDVNGYTIQKGGVEYFVKDGIVTKEVMADGTITNYEYEPEHVIAEREGIKYRYDRDGKLLYAEENNYRFYYDASYRLVKVIDKDGNEYDYAYTQDDITVNSNQTIPVTLNEIANIAPNNLAIDTLTNTLELSSYPDTYTKLLLHAEAADSSETNHTMAFYGNAHLDSSDKKFGASSVYFDGNGDYLTIPDSDDWSFGSGDFTVDMWVKFSELTHSNTLLAQYTDGYSYSEFKVYADGSADFRAIGTNTASVSSKPGEFTAGRWYHIALVRDGDNFKIYKDGAAIGQRTVSTSLYDYVTVLTIGASNVGFSAPGEFLSGSIDEFRVSKGIARWTNDFTPTDLEYRNILYNNPGTLTSDPIAITATSLDYILANLNMPAGTNVIFKTRTGASSDVNDGSWSDWVDAVRDADGHKINSPVNKYIQYQAILRTADISNTPSILQIGDYAVKLTYSYRQTFDATAPPDILPFKDYLTLTPQSLSAIDGKSLNYDLSEISQTYDYIKSSMPSDDTVIEIRSYKGDFLEGGPQGGENFEEADITVNITAGHKVTYFVNNRTAATYYRYDDGRLELLVEYSYDDAGSLILVRLPHARDSIDSQIDEARQKIAAEAAEYLRALAEEKGFAYQSIYDNVESVRAEINAERARLRPQLYQEVTRQRWVGWWIFGWWETYRETVEVPQVRDALNQLDEQERQLNEQAARAYASLDSGIKSAEEKLSQDEADALAEINSQEEIFRLKIIEEESTPVILEYYRAILGRDPDEAEVQAWLAKVGYNSGIDVDELKSSLLASDERKSQGAFVEALKAAISDKLNAYLAADEAGKVAILNSLGLSHEETVSLDKNEVDAIITFLDKQNIHFGRSAFVSLEALLKSNNISYDFNELALKSILVDIFTGSISAVSEGELLELSMFALSTTASTYGLTLYNAKLDFEDLTSLRGTEGAEAISSPVIAHLRNNHFVVVTDISSEDKVTYKEMNKGEGGSTYTVSKEDFLMSWTGYAITPSLRGAEGDEAISIIQNKQISADEARRVKGSCLPFLLPLIGLFVSGITAIATGVVAGIAAIVTAVSVAIAPIIAAVATAISGLTTFLIGATAQIFSAISFVGVSLLSGVGALFGGITAAITSSVTGFSLSGLGLAIGKTVVLGALSFGISKGLDALGVNPIVSSLISSFITGGISGLFSSGFSTFSFIAGGLQGLAVQGVSVLGQRLGLDPNLSSIIGLAAGSLIGAGLNGVEVPMFDVETGRQIGTYLATGLDAISYSMGTTILPNVVSELAYYGVGKIGELLGVDPRISYLAGIGIRSSINPGIDPLTGNPRTMWQGIQNGLLSGIASIGINYATQELGIPALWANLGFSAIASAINAGLAVTIGDNPQHKTVFELMFDSYKNNALTFLNYGNENNPWLQAAYAAQILDFSDIVRQKGLVEALNIYGTGFFNAQAVNAIVQSGITIGNYFDSKLKAGQFTLYTNTYGEQYADVAIINLSGQAVGDAFFEQMTNPDGSSFYKLVGKGENYTDHYFRGFGELGKDSYGNVGFWDDATLMDVYNTFKNIQQIDSGYQTYAETTDLQGNILVDANPFGVDTHLTYDSYGKYIDGTINSILAGKTYSFGDAVLKYYDELGLGNSALGIDFTNPDTLGLQFSYSGLSVDDYLSRFNFTEGQKKQITYVLLNGIGNPLGVPPSYMRGLELELAHADPTGASINSIAMFPWSGSTDAKVDNVVTWIGNAYLGGHELRDNIVNGMIAQFNGQIPSNMTALAYSGSGDSLIQTANANPSWDMKAIVLVNTPLGYNRQITNPNVNNVIMIGGTGDPLSEQGFENQGFDTNPTPLNVYKIALIGVGHTQFSYDPNNTNPDPVAVQSARFSAEMLARGNNTILLQNFLTKQIEVGSITYDSNTKLYFVDLNKVQYEN